MSGILSDMRKYKHSLTGKTAELPDTSFYRNHPYLTIVEEAVVPSTESLLVVTEPEVEDDKEEEAKDE